MMADPRLTELERLLIRHEGLELKPYRCAAGRWTVGVGYNFEDRGTAAMARALGRPVTVDELFERGLTREEALTVLRADIVAFDAEVRRAWPAYDRLDPVRRSVVLDFAFNLGTARAMGFRRMRQAVELALRQPDPAVAGACYAGAAYHLADSLWAHQVDDGLGGRYGRVDRLCEAMWSGRIPAR